MAEVANPELIAAARAIANAVAAACAIHEQAEHDGEPCMEHRAGMVAYIAHKIGLGGLGRGSVEGVALIVTALADYEKHHEEHVHDDYAGPAPGDNTVLGR